MAASQKTHHEALSAVPDSDLNWRYRTLLGLRKRAILMAVSSTLLVLLAHFLRSQLPPVEDEHIASTISQVWFIATVIASGLCAFSLLYFGNHAWKLHRAIVVMRAEIERRQST